MNSAGHLERRAMVIDGYFNTSDKGVSSFAKPVISVALLLQLMIAECNYFMFFISI